MIMKKLLTLALICMILLPSCNPQSNESTEDTVGTTIAETEEQTVTDAPTEATTEEEKIMYFVRPYKEAAEEDLRLEIFEYEDIDAAKEYVDDPKIAALGYAVYDDEGNFVYGKYNEFVTVLLGEAKHVADFMKAEKYAYGDAKTNPAVTYKKYLEGKPLTEKVVSCDRFVGWCLYNIGYTDQPIQSGLFVWNNGSVHDMGTYLEKKGFEKIEKLKQLQAGDIVFVNPAKSSSGKTYPAHVFLCAGKAGSGSTYYRYDAGSQNRIRCESVSGFGANYSAYRKTGQPFKEAISNFMFAYRYVENVSEPPQD